MYFYKAQNHVQLWLPPINELAANRGVFSAWKVNLRAAGIQMAMNGIP